ncbi:MAG: hypothetical protein HRU15_18900 [Planctomycetes bacterium]|nr:hypothetical protein [Planctomycetota bacterium]
MTLKHLPVVALVILMQAQFLSAVEDIDLNGVIWQAAGASVEDMAELKAPRADLVWLDTPMPMRTWPDVVEGIDWKDEAVTDKLIMKQPGAWLRRSLSLTQEQVDADVHFSWEIISYRFDLFVNGKHAGGQPYYAPGSFKLASGLLQAGENEIAIRVYNWDAMPKGGLRNIPTVPVGAALFGWGGKSGGIQGVLELDLYHQQRIRNVLMQPQIDTSMVRAVVLLDDAKVGSEITLSIADASGKDVVAQRQKITAADVKAGKIQIDAKIPNLHLWTPGDTYLYTYRCHLAQSDSKSGHFGMREMKVVGNDFHLNGKPESIRGSNILGEWRWDNRKILKTTGKTRDEYLKWYFSDRAREMNVNAFRTHTLPPTREVCNLLDKEGIYLMAEMPLTYNFQILKFNEKDYKHWHATGEKMILQWMEFLYNHPSVVMWVPTNEAVGEPQFDQDKWEIEGLVPQMKSLDPTRIILRSGRDGTEVADHHSYAGFWGGSVGSFRTGCEDIAAGYPDKPIFNTEYIESLHKDVLWQYTGYKEWTLAGDYFTATTGMRQTEAMRRLKYDGVLPYMFRGWAVRPRYQGEGDSRMFTSLRSALSPVAVSIDLDDYNIAAASTKTLEVYVMNDLAEDVEVTMNYYVLTEDPDFLYDGAAYSDDKRFLKQKISLKSREHIVKKIDFKIPAVAGVAGEQRMWLVAVMEREGAITVMSQRDIRVIDNSWMPASIKNKTYRIIGINDASFMSALGLDVVAGKPSYREDPRDMLIVWENPDSGPKNAYMGQCIQDYISAGKRVMFMRQKRGWKQKFFKHMASLPTGPDVDFDVDAHRSSSAFAAVEEGGAADPVIFKNMKHHYLMFANGTTNDVCRETLMEAPTLTQPPAFESPSGQQASSADTIIIESEGVASSSFVVDHQDDFFTEMIDDKVTQKNFKYQRGGSATLLSTMKAPENEYYEIALKFTTEKDLESGNMWVFEQGRRWASAFEWQIDSAGWHEVGSEIPMQLWSKVGDKGAPTFAWSPIGIVGKLAAGDHLLKIRCNKAKADNGHYLLSQDCFMIIPGLAQSETLIKSGDHNKPLLMRSKVGKSEILLTSLIMASRVNRTLPDYDPAMERLLFNLMAFEE